MVAYPEYQILGAWQIPGGVEPGKSRTMQDDSIDWQALNVQVADDVLKYSSDLDQGIRFNKNGKGVLKDAARGRVKFTYHFECDTSRAYAQWVDSAGYFVEDPGSPLIPCVLHIGEAVYELLREPDVPIRDTVELSRQLWVERTLVSENYFIMVRKSD